VWDKIGLRIITQKFMPYMEGILSLF